MELWLLILIPIVTSLMIALSPEALAKRIAMLGSLVGLGGAGWAMTRFDWSNTAQFQFTGSVSFIEPLGINLSVGVDSIALWLIVLAAFLQPLCVWGSYTAITDRVRTYYAWLMALQAAMIGVFAARDLIFFYMSFEFTLVPMYILISLYGSTNRKKAATKFFLYTFTGSIIALAGLVYVAYVAASDLGRWTFEIDTLQEVAAGLTAREQGFILFALMAGFAVKVPLFPVHTWLPLAHTEAPTAGSVVLAGVLLKLGTYAIYRFVLPFVPLAVAEYTWLIADFAIIGILYGGLICWVQRDVKKLVAYSSVAHLGFCILGMFSMNTIGLAGSVLYMINHGLSTGALFFCIGFMYERYHTRSLEEVGGLAKKMPVWAFFMVFFSMASVGLPGLNGFVSEFYCLLGAFQSGADSIGVGGTPGRLGPWYAAVAGVGMIVAAMYLLLMVGKIVFGPYREPQGHHHHGPLPADLSAREIGVLTPLALGCILLGVYPTPIIKTLEAPIAQTIKISTSSTQTSGIGVPPVISSTSSPLASTAQEAAE